MRLIKDKWDIKVEYETFVAEDIITSKLISFGFCQRGAKGLFYPVEDINLVVDMNYISTKHIVKIIGMNLTVEEAVSAKILVEKVIKLAEC